eukprot:927847-Karenia_brevis.AAC.1
MTHTKAAPPMIYSIINGYTVGPGYMWGRAYKCFALDDFVGLNLSIDTSYKAFSSLWRQEYITSRVWMPDGDIVFPLKS